MRTFLLFCSSLPLYFASGLIIHACFALDYSTTSPVMASLIFGFTGGFIFFIFISKFTPIYIFGHELAHWIFAKVFMKETGKFKVGKDGGAVEIKNPNLWIALAPYFYPTFTVFWIPFWFLFKHFEDRFHHSLSIYFTVLAITWAYHVAMTLYALKFEQSDLKRYGKPLSFSVILFVNMVIIFSFLALFTTGITSGLNVLKDVSVLDCMKIYDLCKEFYSFLVN